MQSQKASQFRRVARELQGGSGFSHECRLGGGFFVAESQDLPVGVVLEPADRQVRDI
jgi:hypothetical protein